MLLPTKKGSHTVVPAGTRFAVRNDRDTTSSYRMDCPEFSVSDRIQPSRAYSRIRTTARPTRVADAAFADARSTTFSPFSLRSFRRGGRE